MKRTKGMILAGGTGTRLWPLTKVTNKHLLPVGPYPALFYPLNTIRELGIEQVMVTVGGESISEIMRCLGSGRAFGCEICYRVQDEAGGIAQAAGLGRDFVGDNDVAIVLGDNIFADNVGPIVESHPRRPGDACIFLKKVPDAYRFGVAELGEEGRVVGIEEKPEHPKSDCAVTGLYLYPSEVFEVIPELRPSRRGELEITDVNNHFVRAGKMASVVLEDFWCDAGTFESLQRASNFAFDHRARWAHMEAFAPR